MTFRSQSESRDYETRWEALIFGGKDHPVWGFPGVIGGPFELFAEPGQKKPARILASNWLKDIEGDEVKIKQVIILDSFPIPFHDRMFNVQWFQSKWRPDPKIKTFKDQVRRFKKLTSTAPKLAARAWKSEDFPREIRDRHIIAFRDTPKFSELRKAYKLIEEYERKTNEKRKRVLAFHIGTYLTRLKVLSNLRKKYGESADTKFSIGDTKVEKLSPGDMEEMKKLARELFKTSSPNFSPPRQAIYFRDAFIYGLSLDELTAYKGNLLIDGLGTNKKSWDRAFSDPCPACSGKRIHLNIDQIEQLDDVIQRKEPGRTLRARILLKRHFKEVFLYKQLKFIPLHSKYFGD